MPYIFRVPLGIVDQVSIFIVEQFKRLGKSEIELVNIFIEGLAAIIKLEQKLEAGEDIETDIALVSICLFLCSISYGPYGAYLQTLLTGKISQFFISADESTSSMASNLGLLI